MCGDQQIHIFRKRGGVVKLTRVVQEVKNDS
jgi:hypothetical protein